MNSVTFSFSMNSPLQTVCEQVTLIDDNIVEDEETFQVTLDSVTPGVVIDSPDVQTIYIVDNDVAVIGFDDTIYYVNESAETAVVTVRLFSGGLSSAVVIRLTTEDNTAQAPGDYSSITEFLTFSPDDVSFDVFISITDDVFEPHTEDFLVRLTVPADVSIVADPDTATININDDDVPIPMFDKTMYTVSENNRSTPLCVDIGVEITQPMILTVITTQRFPQQEAEDTDFRTSAQITINPPGPMACIDFTSLVVDDDVAMEGDEAFTIQVGDSVAVVTIIDDDVPIITTPDGGVLEKNGSLAHVCVELESQIEMPFELLYWTEDGSATDGADYIGTNGNIIFMPREADVICNDIDILDDDIEEQNEFFSIIFSFVNVSAESSLITITISDDDQIDQEDGSKFISFFTVVLPLVVGVFILTIVLVTAALVIVLCKRRKQGGNRQREFVEHIYDVPGVIIKSKPQSELRQKEGAMDTNDELSRNLYEMKSNVAYGCIGSVQQRSANVPPSRAQSSEVSSL
jgi:hypothetical protein